MDAWRSHNVDETMPISLQEFCIFVLSPENSTCDDTHLENKIVNECYREHCKGKQTEIMKALDEKIKLYYRENVEFLRGRLDIASSPITSSEQSKPESSQRFGF